MKAYIVRHGDAVDIGDTSVETDDDRFLSSKGEKRTAEIAQVLANMGCAPQRIVTSPLTRAVQTAEILARYVQTKKSLRTDDILGPGIDTDDVVEWIATLKLKSVMLVGHNPALVYLIAALVSKSGDAQVELKKSGACCVSFDRKVKRGGGCIEWLLQPKQLETICATS